ncbi:MAG: type II toxin-antitoxin system RelE/ParE family toxin [Chloroflexi bacterium]|nr:type II toxin-antitoxin system RelE/ParE family toxin [Chloroflexota bacterium]
MNRLVLTSKFERAYRKFVRRDKRLKQRIDEALQLLEVDAFTSKLGTHKLGGQLHGAWACSCGYDCRIVFSVEHDNETNETIILLINIGTHDEVY